MFFLDMGCSDLGIMRGAGILSTGVLAVPGSINIAILVEDNLMVQVATGSLYTDSAWEINISNTSLTVRISFIL